MHNLARSDLGRLRSSAANISETDKDIQNRIFYLLRFLLR